MPLSSCLVASMTFQPRLRPLFSGRFNSNLTDALAPPCPLDELYVPASWKTKRNSTGACKFPHSSLQANELCFSQETCVFNYSLCDEEGWWEKQVSAALIKFWTKKFARHTEMRCFECWGQKWHALDFPAVLSKAACTICLTSSSVASGAALVAGLCSRICRR